MRNLITIQALFTFQLLFFSVAPKADDSTAPMERAEQEALYSAIQGFVGKSWNGSELYPDPCGWTPIQGVSCDLFNGLWHITVLNVGPILENSLVCARGADFSSYLFELKHLKSLSFFNCLSHPTTIPFQRWEKLTGSLETLEFRSNQGLTGEIPVSLGRLTNLRSLVLVENSLTGALPQEFGNLVRLKRLVLSGNQFSSQIPASLGYNLTELLILDLSRNALLGPLPSALGELCSLVKLDLSGNLLGGKLPLELGKLRNLTLLDLRNNKLSGGFTASLQGMASLQEMLLSNNPLGGNITDFPWQSMKNLTTLDLSNMGLSGNIPESIAGLRRLRFLALDNNHLFGSVSSKLATLPTVGALHLNGNNLTGALEFSEGFYERMGRRFAAWDNPCLCYSVGVVITGHSPIGVQQCKQERGVSASSSEPKINKVGNGYPDQSSGFVASFGFSASSIDGFWWVVLVKELLLLLLLVLSALLL